MKCAVILLIKKKHQLWLRWHLLGLLLFLNLTCWHSRDKLKKFFIPTGVGSSGEDSLKRRLIYRRSIARRIVSAKEIALKSLNPFFWQRRDRSRKETTVPKVSRLRRARCFALSFCQVSPQKNDPKNMWWNVDIQPPLKRRLNTIYNRMGATEAAP